MHHSQPTPSSTTTKQKWQEPMILVERSLNASAQGPAFGPLSSTPNTSSGLPTE